MSTILNQETVTVPIDAVQPHPRNVNEGDIGAIHESITHNGFFGSLIVQRSTGYILAGTHRHRAAQQAGYPEVPVTYVDVDDATALRIMLADNRTARLGRDDPAELAALLQEIHAEAGDLAGTAFSADDLDDLLKSLTPAGADDWGNTLGGLADGDRAPFQQKTFTLHDEQAETVERAISAAKALGPFVDSPNENSNGNALARVCELFLLSQEGAHVG